MHPILDDPANLSHFDSKNLLSSINSLSLQSADAYAIASKISVPSEYSQATSLVMCGMGGSGLGARIIESLYGNQIPIPLIRVNDYHLPAWVNDRSLVIVSSYSGTTEETIDNLKEAIAKKAKVIVIASGGELISRAKQYSVPFYQINPQHNPCNEPRMAIGYSVFGQLALLDAAGLIHLNSETVNLVFAAMNQVVNSYNPQVLSDQNLAKQLAITLTDKSLIIVSGKYLTGAAHTFKNQCNENAKHYCDLFEIPELNHHLMEGLRFPVENSSRFHALLLNSHLYPERIQKRFQLTAEIFTQNHIDITLWSPKSLDPLAQAFETIQFGSYVVYYLVALHQIDPSPIPWVDSFKTKLNN